MAWIKTNDRLPEIGESVTCRLQQVFNGTVVEHELCRVDESDCTWRTADDGSEISYSFNVIEWEER